MFQVKHYMLPHEGVIPGARGHRKVTIPIGTKVYCIVHGTLIYWCAYLSEADAMQCKVGLEACVLGKAKQTIPLATLVAWNFKDAIPRRVCRPKGD